MQRKILSLFLLGFLFVMPWRVEASDSTIEWTQEETEFIASHPVVRIGVDPEFVPFEFIDNGEYKGIASDYVSIIEEKTGIDFQVTPGLSWPKAYDEAVEGNIDVLPAISKTPAREEIFLFSEAYYEVRRVIVTRNDNTSIKDLDDMYGKIVAVQINSSHHTFLLQYPEISLSLYNTVNDAIAAVSAGTEEVFVGNLATSVYIAESFGISNLKFFVLSSEEPVELHFAIRSDWPVLVDIIDKALESITIAEKQEISSEWITIDITPDYGPFIKSVAIGAAILLTGLLISVFWTVKLKKEVAIREKTQKELETAKRDAENANNVKSGFLARMSHEIRTPLNAISGMSYILEKDCQTPTQGMYAKRISQASEAMLGIINDILDYSKIEAGKTSIEVISFNLDQVIQNTISIVSVRISEKKLGFRFTKGNGVPVWLFGDPKRLEQILINILNNAVKFTDKGEVRLNIDVKSNDNGIITICFTIADTGIGMSKETLDNLFVPFVQADSSITRRFGGTGLGLSIAKNLAELMGGIILTESVEGLGTTFKISLPFEVDVMKEENRCKEEINQEIKNLNILVLDDNPYDLDIIASYLSAFCLRAQTAGSVYEAKQILEDGAKKGGNQIDILIVDYNLKLEDGFAFVRSLNNETMKDKMPKIIMMFPFDRPELFDLMGKSGISEGIDKPIIPSVLLNKIMQLASLEKASADNEKHDETFAIPKEKALILMADDNETNRMITKILLEQDGYRVIAVENGKLATEAFAEEGKNISLVLMDLNMPVMDGCEASDLIIQMSPFIPIVAITAEATPGVREKCREHGVFHYISKPFDPKTFPSFVDKIIDNNITRSMEPQIDKESGLARNKGDMEAYLDSLKRFANENVNAFEDLWHAIEKSDCQKAESAVHRVSEGAMLIGAEKVGPTCKEILNEISVRNRSEVIRLAEKFEWQLEMIMREIISELRKK
ncbi:MAG TPA: transporter substrate-binding domain-containing protein [Bacillota bacterium]|nr:transporter substrate-binding domain-containing protein [Bacillota bacterium]